MFGFPEPFSIFIAFLINTATGGTFVINEKDLSLYTVITTGIINPASFAVLSLNSFTNCMMFTPLPPNAGPTGGAGVAFAASICNLIIFEISFSAILKFRLL